MAEHKFKIGQDVYFHPKKEVVPLGGTGWRLG